MDKNIKLLIASDIHGSAKYAGILQGLFARHQPQKLVLLGDLLYHGPRNDLPEEYRPKEVIAVLNALKDKILAVRGNCEAEVDQMVLEFPVLAEYAAIYAGGATIYLTHGHHIGNGLLPLAKGNILLSGHTHVGEERVEDGVAYLNPGSIALPKDGHHSYMLLENGVFTRYDIEGNVLGRWHPA